MTKLYHHTFRPWVVREDGTRIVALERTWSRVLKWDKDAAKTGERVRVNIGVDVFDGWTGKFVDGGGGTIYRSATGGWLFGSKPSPRSSLLGAADVRRRSFDLIDQTPNIDWLIETKRPENIAKMMPVYFPGGYIAEAGRMNQEGPRPNVWLGTSVENQKTAEERIPHLLKVPAAVRFLSCEPLLGPVDLTRCEMKDKSGWWNALDGRLGCVAKGIDRPDFEVVTEEPLTNRVDWVICGGESGHGARPMHPDWARSLRDQCQAAGVAFWFDGWGEWEPSFDFPKQFEGVPDSAPCMILASDGHTGHSDSAMAGHPNPGLMVRTGKSRAGRLLDGREWNELPEVGK